jgi:hypothetical protein
MNYLFVRSDPYQLSLYRCSVAPVLMPVESRVRQPEQDMGQKPLNTVVVASSAGGTDGHPSVDVA